MPSPELVLVTGLAQTLERELADRLEHPATLALADTDEALVDERLQDVEIGYGDPVRGVESAAAAEDREPCEQAPLVSVQQLV